MIIFIVIKHDKKNSLLHQLSLFQPGVNLKCLCVCGLKHAWRF
jgi:hypothetical protein